MPKEAASLQRVGVGPADVLARGRVLGHAAAAVSAENAGGLLGTTTAAATWKTAESPYMGRDRAWRRGP